MARYTALFTLTLSTINNVVLALEEDNAISGPRSLKKTGLSTSSIAVTAVAAVTLMAAVAAVAWFFLFKEFHEEELGEEEFHEEEEEAYHDAISPEEAKAEKKAKKAERRAKAKAEAEANLSRIVPDEFHGFDDDIFGYDLQTKTVEEIPCTASEAGTKCEGKCYQSAYEEGVERKECPGAGWLSSPSCFCMPKAFPKPNTPKPYKISESNRLYVHEKDKADDVNVKA